MLILRRVGPNVGEVEIACHEGTAFHLTDERNLGIALASHLLVLHAEGIVLVLTEQLGYLNRQVLIGLETHQIAPGRVTIFSRTSSDAYCKAAWMSSVFRVG